MNEFDIVSIVSVAFFGSLGHCIGMCGGFVVAYSSVKLEGSKSKMQQVAAHAIYNAGRISSYALIGAVFGFLGSVAMVGNISKGVLFLTLGVFMILVALSLIGKSKVLNSAELLISNSLFFKKSFSYLMRSNKISSFYLLGALNGFIPCGFVYFFAASAAATQSAAWGAAVMLIFGLSTVPAMSALGGFVGLVQNISFRGFMLKLSAFTIAVYGLYIFLRGSRLLFA